MMPADWPKLWRAMDRACRKHFEMEYLDCTPAMVEFAMKRELAEATDRAAAAGALLDRARAAKADEAQCHNRGFDRCVYLAPPIRSTTGDIVGWQMEHVAVVHERRCPKAATS